MALVNSVVVVDSIESVAFAAASAVVAFASVVVVVATVVESAPAAVV